MNLVSSSKPPKGGKYAMAKPRNPTPRDEADALRRQAEARLAQEKTPQKSAALSSDQDPQAGRLIHELRVYQIELELQNQAYMDSSRFARRRIGDRRCGSVAVVYPAWLENRSPGLHGIRVPGAYRCNGSDKASLVIGFAGYRSDLWRHDRRGSRAQTWVGTGFRVKETGAG